MPFSEQNGYVPVNIDAIMTEFMNNLNTQFGMSYTMDSFIGSNWYKYFYAIAQLVQRGEVTTSEVFLKLQQYFTITNERISRPVVTSPGLIEKLTSAGYVASVKAPIDADAGKLFVAVDVDNSDPDYAAMKLEIATLIMNSSAGGIVSQGAQVQNIVISNGQAFDYKFNLPNRIATLLRLTITLSENNQSVIQSTEEVAVKLLANINAKYRLGLNFEPQKYFSTYDAPWASNVLLEYSHNSGSTWASTIYDAAYNDLFDIDLEDIEIVEN